MFSLRRVLKHALDINNFGINGGLNMSNLNLKVQKLRKTKGISQQTLATNLGVTFQTVSKWENGVSMPDISLLPKIAEFFEVSVDQLLGLRPLPSDSYIERDSDNRDSWNKKSNTLYKNRKYFWNEDYLQFIVDKVWNIHSPVDILDYRCGNGYFGAQLMKLLPEGSTYTGIDSEFFIEESKSHFKSENLSGTFISEDIYSASIDRLFHITICQCGLRHLNTPILLMENMMKHTKKDGLVACIDINREIENVGLYVDKIDYNYLCSSFDYRTLWQKELVTEGRDYAIGMRLPLYMKEIGLKNIDVRLSDKITFIDSTKEDYHETIQDFIRIQGLDKEFSSSQCEKIIELLMSRDLSRAQAQSYLDKNKKLSAYFNDPSTEKSFLQIYGLIISFGYKS